MGVTIYLSETSKVAVGKEVSSLDVSTQFNAYSGVEIIVDDDTSIFVGNRSSRVLTIENPWGTREQATAILNALQANGFQYQPYTASGAILNPAAEIGDGITVWDTYSGIYKMGRKYTPLMAADVEAPQDEEIDHEFPYEAKQDRKYRREIADAKAEIAITQNQISSEVTRATNAENSLSSKITQTANSITASVLAKKGGSSSSCGWTRTDSSWTLQSGGKTVFKCTSSGVEVNGKITATSGSIGGFTIGSTKLYNGMTSLGDTTNNGVYIGTDGIALGKGKFKVTSSGSISAANMTLTGTLSVGGANITAAALRQGAERANSGYSNWNSAYSSTSSGGYCYKGATNGNTALDKVNSLVAGNITADTLKATGMNCSTLRIGGRVVTTGSWTLCTGIYVQKDNSTGYVTGVTAYTNTFSPLVFGGYY